jgi:hypothetical protein
MSENKLTEDQQDLVNFILTQGIIAERLRLTEFVNEFEQDSVPKNDILAAINEG